MNVGLALLTLFPGRAGGAETYVRGLTNAFANGDGAEMTTLLLNRNNRSSFPSQTSSNMTSVCIGAYRPGDSSLTRLIAMTAAHLAPRTIADAVPSGLDLMHYPVTVPIPRVAGIPRVVSLLDVQHHDLPQLFSAGERAYRRWAYDNAARDADRVITISDFSAGRISAELGIPRDEIDVIHLGIDHDRFQPDGPTASIPGLPERYLYYPANSWPHKNHELLLEAFKMIHDADLHLVLSGSAAAGSVMREADSRVHHLGNVPADQVAPLLRGAQAMVFPSLYEGFGFPPLEAMACGCPVAASQIGAVSEVCGDAALLFDPAEPKLIAAAIRQITGDEGLRAKLTVLGIRQASKFTWQQTALGHRAVYQAVAERPR